MCSACAGPVGRDASDAEGCGLGLREVRVAVGLGPGSEGWGVGPGSSDGASCTDAVIAEVEGIGAARDLEALRSAFDSNGDGKLTSADADFAKFKLLVTKADGAAEAKTHAELNITEIDLTGDATHIELPDGSMISGQTRAVGVSS